MGSQNSKPFTRPVRVQIGNGFDFIAKKPSHLQRRLETWLNDYNDQTLRVYHETLEDYDRVATDIIPDVLQRKFNGQITLQHLQPRVRDRALEQARLGASEFSSLPIAAAEGFLRQNKWIRYALNARSVFGRGESGFFPPNYNAPSAFSMQGPAPIVPPAHPVAPASNRRAVGPFAASAAGTAAAVLVDPVAAVVIGAAAVGIYSYARYLEGKKMYVLELQPVPNLPLQPPQSSFASSSVTATDTPIDGPITPSQAHPIATTSFAGPVAFGATTAPLSVPSQFAPSSSVSNGQGPSVMPIGVAPADAVPSVSSGVGLPFVSSGPSASQQTSAIPGSNVSAQVNQSIHPNVGIPVYDRVPVGSFIHPSTLLMQNQLPVPSRTQSLSQTFVQSHPINQTTFINTDVPTPIERLDVHPHTTQRQAPAITVPPTQDHTVAVSVPTPATTTALSPAQAMLFQTQPQATVTVTAPTHAQLVPQTPVAYNQGATISPSTASAWQVSYNGPSLQQPATLTSASQPYVSPPVSSLPTIPSPAPAAHQLTSDAVPVAQSHFISGGSSEGGVGYQSLGNSSSESTTTLPPLSSEQGRVESISDSEEGHSQPAGHSQSTVISLSSEGQQPLSTKTASYPSVYPQVEQELFWPHSLNAESQGSAQRQPSYPRVQPSASSVDSFRLISSWHPGQC